MHQIFISLWEIIMLKINQDWELVFTFFWSEDKILCHKAEFSLAYKQGNKLWNREIITYAFYLNIDVCVEYNISMCTFINSLRNSVVTSSLRHSQKSQILCGNKIQNTLHPAQLHYTDTETKTCSFRFYLNFCKSWISF